MKDRNYFGAMMVETGEADALISGLTKDYPRTILPSLHIIGGEKRSGQSGWHVHHETQIKGRFSSQIPRYK